MANFNKKAALTCVMIVQQLEPEYWLDWDAKIIEQAQNGTIKPLLEEVVKRIENNNCIVSEAYGVKHDKDTIEIWNNEQKQNISQLKANHAHFLIKFDKGATLDALASYSGIEPQYLEKAKSGRYGYDNLLAYLVHSKDKNKYQYLPDEVVTVKGEEYNSVYNRRMETWFKGRATKEAIEANLSVDYLISEILEGRISKNEILLTDNYYKVYALNQRKIEDAFSVYAEKKGYMTIQELENNEFKKTVFFLTGESGVGKTRFAKLLISMIKEIALNYDERWEHSITASTNPFDDYTGQEILIMDDVRGSSLTVSDWLKLLDPYTISPISARYRNKVGSAKIIFITSIKSPLKFFYESKGSSNEDIGQFIRRLDLLVAVYSNDCRISSPIVIKKDINCEQGEIVEEQKKLLTEKKSSYLFSDEIIYNKEDTIAEILNIVKVNMQWTEEKACSLLE